MAIENTIQLFGELPKERRLAYLMRHSARFPITNDRDVFTAALTPEGVAMAQNFGSALAGVRRIGRVHSSPVGRCVDTALAVSGTAGWHGKVQVDHHLSHPYTAPIWDALPFCHPTSPVPPQLVNLVDFIFNRPEQPGVLDLFVTHDTVVGSLAGYLFCEKFTLASLPDYLEGAFLWQEKDEIQVLWRGQRAVFPWHRGLGNSPHRASKKSPGLAAAT